jgi:hypothetical protein
MWSRKKKNGSLISLFARELDGNRQDQGGFAGYGPRVTQWYRADARPSGIWHIRARQETAAMRDFDL